MEDYWDKRAKDPRLLALFVTIANTIYQLLQFLKEMSTRQMVMNSIYTVISLIIFALIFYSYKKSNFTKEIRCAFMIMSIRNVCRLYDFEATRDTMPGP